MSKPFIPNGRLYDHIIHQSWERYLPDTFDDSMTLLQKVNQIILQMGRVTDQSNDLIDRWNELMRWMLEEGFSQVIIDLMNQWYEEGRFADLVIQIIDKLKEQGVSITTYGAVGDGKTDSVEAFDAAIASGFPVFIPAGTFVVSRGIKLPSNTVIMGAGIDNAIVKFMDNVPYGDSLFMNENIVQGNQNIHLSGFTTNGNAVTRFGPNSSGSAGSRDSNITFRAVKGGSISNIKATDCLLHGIDITCGGLDYPYNGDDTVAPYPSENITIIKCEAEKFGDDGITTHHSQYISIIDSYSHDPRNTANCNGFEVDDGSRHIQLANNRSARCYSGIEVKAHTGAPAPYDVSINGHMSVNDCRSYNFRHIGHHSATDPDSKTARNIIASDLISINPNNVRGFQDDSNPRALQISAYNGVTINGFSAFTDQPGLITDNIATIQYKARNINISNAIFTGFNQTENGIYVIGGSQNADNVNIVNCVFNNSSRRPISIGSTTQNISISNVTAMGTVNGAICVVQAINSNLELNGIKGEGYPDLMIIAGTSYKDGLTLFNGGFRAASSSSGYIHKEGSVTASTSSSSAEASKSAVTGSSSSEAKAERSFIAASSTAQVTGEYGAVIGSLDARATNRNNIVLGSSSSDATGNRSSVISSYGVNADGSYKVNGGYGDPDSNGRGKTANKKWELDSLNGNIKATGSITGSNVWTDYAEYFESVDRQPIPSGMLVSLNHDMVKRANGDETIIGVVSETAGVVLGESSFAWQDQFLKNEFGGYLKEWQDVPILDEDDDGNVIQVGTKKELLPVPNPAYDPKAEYVPRSERPEWNIIGLLGQVFVRVDNTVKVGDSLKAVNGIGSAGGNYGLVMKITSDFDSDKGYGIAKVLVK